MSFKQLRPHAIDVDNRPLNRDPDRFRRTFASNGQVNRGARLPAHSIHCFIKSHALNRRLIESNNQITGENTGPVSRCAIDRCHDPDESVVIQGDLYAQTAKFSPCIDIDFTVCLGLKVG